MTLSFTHQIEMCIHKESPPTLFVDAHFNLGPWMGPSPSHLHPSPLLEHVAMIPSSRHLSQNSSILRAFLTCFEP